MVIVGRELEYTVRNSPSGQQRLVCGLHYAYCTAYWRAIWPPNMIEAVSEGIIVCPTDEVKTKAIGVQ